MGSSQSARQEVDNVITSWMSAVSTATQNTKASYVFSNKVTLVNCSMNVDNLEQTVTINIDDENFMKSVISIMASMTTNEKLKQQAKEITQNLSLAANKQKTDQITKLLTKLAQVVESHVSQLNSDSLAGGNLFEAYTCTDKLEIRHFTQKSVTNAYRKSVLDSSQVTDAKNELIQALSQDSSMKVKNAIAIVALIAVIGMIAFMMLRANMASGLRSGLMGGTNDGRRRSGHHTMKGLGILAIFGTLAYLGYEDCKSRHFICKDSGKKFEVSGTILVVGVVLAGLGFVM